MAWIYENDYNDSVRYVLGEEGTNPLACFGINPSTARPDDLDRTLTSVRTIAERKGYDGWLMFNVYPQRSTDPNGLHKKIDSESHKRNVMAIKETMTRWQVKTAWAAWGTLIEKRNYLFECVADIYQAVAGNDLQWMSMGKLTKAGHPHHPLYLAHDSQMKKFKMAQYVTSFKR